MHLAVHNGAQRRGLLYRPQAGGSAAGRHPEVDHDLLLALADLDRLDAEPVDRLQERLEPAPDPGVAAVGAGLRGQLRRRDHLEVLVHEWQHRLEPVPGHGGERGETGSTLLAPCV